MPSSTPKGQENDARAYALGNLLACLHSLREHDRAHDILVTTNDAELLEQIARYRKSASHRLELMRVTAEETLATFRTSPDRLANAACAKFVFTKFFPIFRRMAPWIVHLDFDTMAASRLDFGGHAGAGLSLIDTNQFAPWDPWKPTSHEVAFFGLERVAPRWKWINTGVFSVRDVGFELCEQVMGHFLANLERAAATKVDENGDEVVLNALAMRGHRSLAVRSDANDNLLAYYLPGAPAWRKTARVIHFHSHLKPTIFFRGRDEQVAFECTPQMARQVTPDFYLASLRWLRHLHAAAGPLGLELKGMKRMPLEFVEGEVGRVAGFLEERTRGRVG
jgi:hypothetical protein